MENNVYYIVVYGATVQIRLFSLMLRQKFPLHIEVAKSGHTMMLNESIQTYNRKIRILKIKTIDNSNEFLLPQ